MSAPEPDHVVCCDPARALCGAKVMGQAVLFGPPDLSTRPCQKCFNLAADGARCGEPMCPGGEE